MYDEKVDACNKKTSKLAFSILRSVRQAREAATRVSEGRWPNNDNKPAPRRDVR